MCFVSKLNEYYNGKDDNDKGNFAERKFYTLKLPPGI